MVRSLVVIVSMLFFGGIHNSWGDTLTLSMPEEFPPYTFEEDGVWKGIDVDIAKALYPSLGYDLKFVPLPWPRQLKYAKEGEMDGILTVYCEDKRDFLTLSSEPFYDVKISLFTHKEKHIAIKSLNDVPDGATVVAVRGNYFNDEIVRGNRLNLVEARDTPLLVEQLVKRRHDYALDEYFPFLSYARQRSYSSKVVEVLTLQTNEVCAGFSNLRLKRDHPDLMPKLNAAIADLKSRGVIQEIIKRYIE